MSYIGLYEEVDLVSRRLCLEVSYLISTLVDDRLMSTWCCWLETMNAGLIKLVLDFTWSVLVMKIQRG